MNDVAFSPDGKYLATAGEDNAARMWEVPTGKKVTPALEHDAVVHDVTFSADGKYLATASEDGTARLWEVPSGHEVARMKHPNIVSDLIFSPDGEYLATTSADNVARLWLWYPENLADEACSRLTRNLTKDEWQLYLDDESPRKTCPRLPEPG